MLEQILSLVLLSTLCINGQFKKAINSAIKPLKKDIDGLWDDVKDIADDIDDLSSGQLDIKNLVNGVDIDLNDLAKSLAEVPFQVLDLYRIISLNIWDDLIGNSKKDFADTLKSCTLGMQGILDPETAIKKILNIDIDISFFGNLPDSTDIAFKALAYALEPVKSLLIFVCDDIIPEAVSFLNKFIKQSFEFEIRRRRRRRRMPQQTKEANPANHECKQVNMSETSVYVPLIENENCYNVKDDTFCESYNFSYFYDGAGHGMYKAMIDEEGPSNCYDGKMDNAENLILGSPYDNSNTEVYQRMRIGKFTLDLVLQITDIVCDAIDGCNQDGPECPFVVRCAAIKTLFGVATSTLEYVMGSADLQDGEINNVRLKAIFKDRITIIHNQKLIHNTLNIVRDAVGRIEDSRRRNLMITDDVNKLDGIIVPIKSRHLIISAIMAIGFNVVFVVIAVVLVLKCYDNKYKGRGKDQYKLCDN